MRTFISIIIPTYKPQDYLWDCLDSIQNQTLSPKYFEVIVVLNGEKEPFYNSIKKKLSQYTFSSKLLYTEKSGVSIARNLGIQEANGTYICFMDDDDWVSPSFLQELFNKATPEGIVETNVIQVEEHTKREIFHFLSHAYQKASQKKKLHIINSRSFFSSVWCKIIPLSIIGNKRFREDITHGEDAFFMFTLSPMVKTINITSKEAIYYVRARKNSASRNKSLRRKKIKMELRLIGIYTITYLRNPLKYNFIFFVTRLLGTIRNIVINPH